MNTREARSKLIEIAGTLLHSKLPSDLVDDYPQKTYSAARVAELETERDQLRSDINITEAGLGISGIYAKLEAERDALQKSVNRLQESLASALDLVEQAKQKTAREIIDEIMGGSFLHDDSPPKLFAKEVTAMLKRKYLPASQD